MMMTMMCILSLASQLLQIVKPNRSVKEKSIKWSYYTVKVSSCECWYRIFIEELLGETLRAVLPWAYPIIHVRTP